MNHTDVEKEVENISALLSDLFEIEAVYPQRDNIVFALTTLYNHKKSVELIKDRLKLAGYRFTLTDEGGRIFLYVDPKQRMRIPTVNVVLFFATLFSVYVVPVFLRNIIPAVDSLARQTVSLPDSFWAELHFFFSAFPLAFDATLQDLSRGIGIEFTLALMSILFVHEMGHFIASRRRNIITSWPYFIPAPNIIGTFGAVIKSKSPFWNRRDLIEVGASGPIAGWIVALFWLLWGLSQSVCLPMDAFTLKEMGFSLEGESLLMKAATLLLVGPAPEGYFYKLTEAAFAGWVGLLVTAINLLPIGQLDGGHILYGLGRRHQYGLGFFAMVVLFLLGFHSMMWWLFAGFGLIFGVKHPPTLNDARPIGTGATIMGVAAMIILILSFTPVPFR